MVLVNGTVSRISLLIACGLVAGTQTRGRAEAVAVWRTGSTSVPHWQHSKIDPNFAD